MLRARKVDTGRFPVLQASDERPEFAGIDAPADGASMARQARDLGDAFILTSARGLAERVTAGRCVGADSLVIVAERRRYGYRIGSCL